MAKIHKNNIRKIKVLVRRGCDIHISTPVSKKLKDWQTPSHYIIFNSLDLNGKSISVYHSTNTGGRCLNIDTRCDENSNIFAYIPYFFRIILPPGCHLSFEYE
jgi:hypothetical protein